MQINNYITDYTLKPDCQRVRKRYNAFWQGKTLSEPLLYIKTQKPVIYPTLPVEPYKTRKKLEFDLNWHLNYCQSQVFNYNFLFDSMPIALIMFGRDITNMGVLSANDFMIHPDSEFITFHEDPNFLFTVTPEFQEDRPFVQKVLGIYEGVMANIGKCACVNPPTTADALTTMAMIMGMENFIRSLKKYPAQVVKKAQELNQLFYDFYNFIYGYLLKWGYGESASWFPVFAEGKFDSVRSDVSVMFSEKFFCEFCLPNLADACNYLDYSMFNLDAVDLIRFWPRLAELQNLNGLYWNIEPWFYELEQHLAVLKQIKEAGLLLALPCRNLACAKMALSKLGKTGLLLEFPIFNSKTEALKTGEAVYEYARPCLY